jgi:hypothetical protein
MSSVRFTVTFDLDEHTDWSIGDVPDGRHEEVMELLPFILATILRDHFVPKDRSATETGPT